jgi:hypothetical protein
MHRCDEKDYELFFPPAKTINKTISELKEKKAFMCINPTDTEGRPPSKKLFGKETMDSYRYYAIKFMPCIPAQLNSSNFHLQDS